MTLGSRARSRAPGRRDRPRDRGRDAAAARARSASSSSREQLVGGASIDAHGTALTDEVLAACRGCGRRAARRRRRPEVGHHRPRRAAARAGAARACARGSACTRTCARCARARRWSRASPLRAERIAGTDLLVVRELTGRDLLRRPRARGDRAHDTCEYSVGEIERIARVAFDAARAGRRRGRPPRVTSVDKANVLETSRLWRETVERGGAAITRTSSSTTCWSTTRRCSSSPTRRGST